MTRLLIFILLVQRNSASDPGISIPISEWYGRLYITTSNLGQVVGVNYQKVRGNLTGCPFVRMCLRSLFLLSIPAPPL